jgi:hypothetical protein
VVEAPRLGREFLVALGLVSLTVGLMPAVAAMSTKVFKENKLIFIQIKYWLTIIIILLLLQLFTILYKLYNIS